MDIHDPIILKSEEIIRRTARKYPTEKIVVAWTGGKDSTVLLHLIRRIYRGSVPFPVMFNDSTMEFPEIYEFIRRITAQWHIRLLSIAHLESDIERFNTSATDQTKLKLARMMKINALERFIEGFKPTAILSGIRWDEHPSRSSERYFSKRKDHMRIHPILHFTESDIWNYIRSFSVPYVPLYDQGYRSLGEQPFTRKAIAGEGERSGREPSKEHMMEKLRNMGYW